MLDRENYTMAEQMPDSREARIAAYFLQSRQALDAAMTDRELAAAVLAIADCLTGALRKGNKLLVAGNGGSAADAQHIAGELLSRLNFDRSPLPAIALTTDTSVLTAIGNDYGFDKIFERQVRGLARQGDVFLAISTSGRSPNILCALQAARDMGVTTIGFTGNRDSAMIALCDLCLRAPAAETPLIQQIHIIAAHSICSIVEQDMFGSARG